MLLSAFYDVPVRDKSYKERVIRIAYDPFNRTFKVADAATDRDPRFVSAMSEVFKTYKDNTFYEYCDAFFDALNDSNEKKGEPAVSDKSSAYLESANRFPAWRLDSANSFPGASERR